MRSKRKGRAFSSKTRVTHLNYFIPREVESRDVHSIASHKISIKHTENTLMCNNKEIVMLTFELKDDRFQPHSEIMVRLAKTQRLELGRHNCTP